LVKAALRRTRKDEGDLLIQRKQIEVMSMQLKEVLAIMSRLFMCNTNYCFSLSNNEKFIWTINKKMQIPRHPNEIQVKEVLSSNVRSSWP